MQKFKNYFWLLLVILSCQGILQAQDNDNCDCVKSTQYVMQFLAKSGTEWWGYEEWAKNIKDLPEGDCVKTNYLYIHDTVTGNSKKYTGAVVEKDSFTKTVPVDTVRAKFIITKNSNGFVIITSLIEDTAVKEVTDLEEIETVKSNIQECNEKEILDKDGYSKCLYKAVVEFDKETNIAKGTSVASCTTTMPLDLFEKEIEKNRNGFN